MILRSIELENFGRFRSQTVEFRRGMNLVIGPNEAGKSTLAEAVPAVLFGSDRLEKFKPWGRNACSAALFFEGRGRTIQVKRNLVTDDVELVEKDDLYHVLSQFSGKVPLRGRSAASREYRDLLESLLGVSDEGLFRATYFFGHHPQEWNGDELAQKLRSLVSGTAETDYAEILDGLLEEHFALTRSNPWGRDKQRDREYEEVCQQLAQQGGAEAVPVFVELDNNAELAGQIEQLTGELDHDRQEYAKGLRYIERVRRQAEESSGTVTPVVASPPPSRPVPPANTGSLSEQLVAAGLPKNPPRELPEMLSEAAEIRQELATLQQPYAALGNREKHVPKVPWLVLSSLVAVLLVVVAVAWWQDFQLLWIAVAAALCSGMLLGWGGWRHVARNKALAECLKERNRLDQKKHTAQQRQADLSERCEFLGLPSSAIDLVRLQKQVAAHRDLLANFWSGGEAAVDGPGSSAQGGTGAVVSDVPSASLDANLAGEELAKLETRMAEFEADLKRKEERLQDLARQLAEAPAESSRQAVTPASKLFARKRDLEGRIAVLRKAVNLLAEAVDEFGKSHLVHLNDEAGKLFGKITGGRYAALKLDENMTPSVQVDSRRWMSFDHFSRGTVDAIYLALRIALAKVRNDGRSLPLMLDDPFVHLDQKRLATALNLVDLAAADGQLILFSHNMELGKRAARERWHVVPLDGDSAVASPEEGDEHVGQLHLL